MLSQQATLTARMLMVDTHLKGVLDIRLPSDRFLIRSLSFVRCITTVLHKLYPVFSFATLCSPDTCLEFGWSLLYILFSHSSCKPVPTKAFTRAYNKSDICSTIDMVLSLDVVLTHAYNPISTKQLTANHECHSTQLI